MQYDQSERLSDVSFELTQEEIEQIKREYNDEKREERKREDEMYKEFVKYEIEQKKIINQQIRGLAPKD